MRGFAVAVAAATVTVLVLAGVVLAEGPVLSGSVGPGFTIGMRDAAGSIPSPAPGPAVIDVDDMSEQHSFHLSGPGVDVFTLVEAIEKKSFQVTLADGVYRFFCDVHPTMRGQFVAGAGSAGGGGGTGSTTPPSARVGSTLTLTSGPGFAISLKTRAGKRVTRLKPGRYAIRVRDRSTMHNAHLLGAGVNRKTPLGRTASQTWTVILKKGTLVFRCDAHPTTMRGTVKVAA